MRVTCLEDVLCVNRIETRVYIEHNFRLLRSESPDNLSPVLSYEAQAQEWLLLSFPKICFGSLGTHLSSSHRFMHYELSCCR